MPIFNGINNLLSQSVMSVSGDDFSIANFNSLNNSNDYVSASSALRNSDLYSVINTISGDLATARLTADKPQIQSFLENPSTTTNGHAFWQAMYTQLLIAGEAFAYIWRNKNGMISRLEYLRPSQVNTFLLSDGSGLVYTITFDEPDLPIKQMEPQGNMIHLRLMSKTGGMVGISPLSALNDEMQIKKESNRLTVNALQKSIMAPGVLKINKGGLLDSSMKSKRSKEFMKQVNNSNGGPIVLDDLEDYTSLEIKSDISKLLAQTDWTTKQIAKVFGIPDSYVNGQGDQQSSLTMIQGMYANSLNRYMQSIVSELNNKFYANITVNLRTATDATGDEYAAKVSSLVSTKIIASDQAAWILTNNGYLSDDMPETKVIVQPPEPSANNTKKGGENDDESSNSN